jgi:hypothetical protein
MEEINSSKISGKQYWAVFGAVYNDEHFLCACHIYKQN